MVPERGMLSEVSSVAGTATNASYLAVLKGVDSACRYGATAQIASTSTEPVVS